jgi:hypothetical protein
MGDLPAKEQSSSRVRAGAPVRRKAERRKCEGVIRSDEAYTLEEVKLRLNLTDSAWWSLISRGLPHKQIGKRKMVLGEDILKYLRAQPDVKVPQGS